MTTLAPEVPMGWAVPQLTLGGPVGGAFASDVPASYRKSEAIAGHPFDVDSLIATAKLNQQPTGRQSAPNTPQDQTSQLPCGNTAARAVCGGALIPLTQALRVRGSFTRFADAGGHTPGRPVTTRSGQRQCMTASPHLSGKPTANEKG